MSRLDAYFEARLAFIDRPDVRIASDEDERGNVLIYATATIGRERYAGRMMLDAEHARRPEARRHIARSLRTDWAIKVEGERL